VSSACYEFPSVHPQEDLYMQFYGISIMQPYKQAGQAHPATVQSAYPFNAEWHIKVSRSDPFKN
jgi:hypothetical protein